MFSKLKCRIGIHVWQKYMGPQNQGSGNFSQKYKCMKCGKIKKEIF